MRIRYLQHEPFEGPAAILEWAAERGHRSGATMLFNGETPPSLDSFDMLVIMGGSMGAYEESLYPWLAAEKRFIGQAILGGKAVLGICLGAQLIASALGAGVRKHSHKEIGWHQIHLTERGAASALFDGWPRSFEALQWHGDTFDLPEGAVLTAGNACCAHQAFEFGGRAVALQFHVEATAESVKLMVEQGGAELECGGPYVQPASGILRRSQNYPHLCELLYRLLDNIENQSRSDGI